MVGVEAQILALMSDGKRRQGREIASELKLTRDAAYPALRRLFNDNMVVYLSDSGGPIQYEITEKGKQHGRSQT